MKYIFWVLLSIVSLSVSAQTIDPQGIINWLHDQGMTIYTTYEAYRPDDLIRRSEAAKMISAYADALQLQADYDGSCVFTDTQGYDPTLLPHITTSCQYGLIKGGRGLYRPNDTLTQAQALTIIQRARGGLQDETGTPRYREYFDDAAELGLVSQSQIISVATTPITRYELGVRLYIAAQTIDIDTQIDPETEYIAQGAVDQPPVVIRSPSTPSDPDDERVVLPADSFRRPPVRDETQFQDGYTRNYNYTTYQPWSQATQDLEIASGKRVVLMFGSSSELTSRALDTNIKNSGVRGNVSILLIDYDTNATLRSQYGVSSAHTLIYLSSDGAELFRTVKKDIQVSQVVENFDRGGAAAAGGATI